MSKVKSILTRFSLKSQSKLKNLYKFFIPVLLLGLVIEILIVSPRMLGTKKESADKSKLTKPVHSTQNSDQVMEGVHLIELKQGEKEWELWAEKAYTLKESGQLILESVKVKIFGGEEATYLVTGKRGEVEVNKKDILISGDVVTKTSNGYIMKTDKTFYNSENRTLDSDSQVHVLGPQDKKDEGPLVLTGNGTHVDLKENQIQILKDVKAHKVFADGRKLSMQSDKARFKATDYTALFDGNVIVDMQNSRVTGDSSILEVNVKTKEVYSMTIFGKVKLTDVQRWAVAHEAQMIFPEKKFILRGAPRVIQDQDELKGEEITFFNEGKQIQIKRAKAKFDKQPMRKTE